MNTILSIYYGIDLAITAIMVVVAIVLVIYLAIWLNKK